METPKKWARFNTEKFPNVIVELEGRIENDWQFQEFLNDWLALYDRRYFFTLTFDTTRVEWINVKYAWKMAAFIKKLKQNSEDTGGVEYITKSTILVNSWYMTKMLQSIFWIQTPVAPVFIAHTKNVTIKRIYNTDSGVLERLEIESKKEASYTDPLLQPDTEDKRKMVRMM